MRELLLTGGGTPQEVERVGTHSCKVTLLAWAARYGMAIEARRALGYHLAPGTDSVLTYSRDALSGPLRLLEEMLAAVRAGRFVPDSTRSGAFTALAAVQDEALLLSSPEVEEVSDGGGEAATDEVSWAVLPPCPALTPEADFGAGELESDDGFGPSPPATPPPTSPEVRDSSGESSSSDSETSEERAEGVVATEADQAAQAEAAADRRQASAQLDQGPPGPLPGHTLMRNRASQTLHWRRPGAALRMMCGRVLHSGYEKLAAWPAFGWPRCAQCFRSGPENPEALPLLVDSPPGSPAGPMGAPEIPLAVAALAQLLGE